MVRVMEKSLSTLPHSIQSAGRTPQLSAIEGAAWGGGKMSCAGSSRTELRHFQSLQR